MHNKGDLAVLHNGNKMVGRGMGPRYLAIKRERGPVRVPSSLREDFLTWSVDVFVLEP